MFRGLNIPAACRPTAMAWFSDRLPQFSSLTDHISNFTKEVLTETTEEIEGKAVVVAERGHILFNAHSVMTAFLVADPAAELQVARKKINELESLNKYIQTEVRVH